MPSTISPAWWLRCARRVPVRRATRGDSRSFTDSQQWRDWGEGVTVEYQTSETRPYMLREIVVSGPDNRRFELRNVPSTTPLSEIARAVLRHYTDDAMLARRSRIRTAIDRVSEDGQAERLDPNRMLGDVGIHDGDELRLVI